MNNKKDEAQLYNDIQLRPESLNIHSKESRKQRSSKKPFTQSNAWPIILFHTLICSQNYPANHLSPKIQIYTLTADEQKSQPKI